MGRDNRTEAILRNRAQRRDGQFRHVRHLGHSLDRMGIRRRRWLLCTPNDPPARPARVAVILTRAHPDSRVAGLSLERPWGFSRAALNFAREEGTGSFYTTGTFRGSMVISNTDVCNVQTCYKACPPPLVRMQGLTRHV